MRLGYLMCLILLAPSSASAGGSQPFTSLEPPTFSIGPLWGDYNAGAAPSLTNEDRAQMNKIPDGPPVYACRIGFWVSGLPAELCHAEYAGAAAMVADIKASNQATLNNLPQPLVSGYNSSDPNSDPNVQSCVNAMMPMIPALEAEDGSMGTVGWPSGIQTTCEDMFSKEINAIMTHD